MPYETLRFLHAARALVDHPLRDTGPIGPDLRSLVRGATTNAFHNVIAECLDQDVDFLLLTGDTLDLSDFSVKARVELCDGFAQLDEAGVQVFLVPGRRDPAAVWNDFPNLPSNVTVFRPESDDPVAVLRDGAVIASIRALSWRQAWFAGDQDESAGHRARSTTEHRPARATDDEIPYADLTQRRVKEADDAETREQSTERSPSKPNAHRDTRRVESPADLRPNHFTIAIVRDGIDSPDDDPQADYLAIVGGRERNTVKGSDWLLHNPGGTQGLSPEESGLHGCSLVELDGDGVIRCRFLPTAPVRWENFEIEIEANTTLEQLVKRMQVKCCGLCGIEEQHQVGEVDDASSQEPSVSASAESLLAQACFIRWTIRGNGSLFNSLTTEQSQVELIEWLDAAADWPLEIPRRHLFRLLATARTEIRAAVDDESDQLDVPTEYWWRIEQAEVLGASAWSDLGQDDAEQCERLARVNVAAPGCDAEVVFSQARRHGKKWFGGTR